MRTLTFRTPTIGCAGSRNSPSKQLRNHRSLVAANSRAAGEIAERESPKREKKHDGFLCLRKIHNFLQIIKTFKFAMEKLYTEICCLEMYSYDVAKHVFKECSIIVTPS